MVKGEHGHASGDQGHDEVFVQWIGFSEYGQVKEHDGEEFARFGEDKGYVVDMREGGVAEGGGERGCDCHEDQGEENGARGEDGWNRLAVRGGDEEVDVACQGGEGRLNGVEEDGVGEFLRGGGGAVDGRCYPFLEESPGEA